LEKKEMKKIRLCIGSNDGENIAENHMGDTECFYIYDFFENSTSEFIEKRINIAKDIEEHASAEKMKMIIKLVKDTDVFVAQKNSPNFVKIANKTKYQPIVVKAEKISDILIVLDRFFKEIYSYVERRKSGEVFDIIPELK
jgi:hypothetical protein